MNEIDVTKCEYYNDYYKTCSNFSRFGDDEPYCDPKGLKCSYYINNIEKQLQQLRTDNKKLCTAIRNELPEQYDKRVSEAESDIEWGVLDRNATEIEFCKNVIYETRNYIAKLEQENEELRSDNSTLLAQGDADAFVISNLNFKIQELQQCIDEIDEICKSTICDYPMNKVEEIIQLIQQVKEGK